MSDLIPGAEARRRILVVEDETIVARDIQLQLEALGYEHAGHTTTGEEAIALAGELRPDLVLMDVKLAGAMDGIAAAEVIRKKYNLPVVFLTAFATDDAVTRAKVTQPFGYVLKPFAERELRTVLEIALYRHQIFTELRASEERARSLVEWSPEALVVHRHGEVLYANPAALALFGLTSAQEALGTSIFAWIQPDSREFIQKRLQDLTRSDITTPMDLLKGRKKDGTTIEVESRSVVMPFDGAPAVHSSMHDITARVRAESALRLQGAALEAAANAIVITDREGTIEWANSAFTTFTGYGMAEAMGRRPGELLKSGRHDRLFYQNMWNTILNGSTWRGEMINRRKNGTLYTEEMTITPLRDEHGKITHFIAVKQDITERKRLEEQFHQAQKLESVGRLAGGVAHDFNNMLGVILGNLELAIPRVDPGQQLHAELLEIKDAAERSAILTRQLLAFARKQAVAPRALDINVFVAEALAMLQRMIGEHITIEYQPGDGVWPIEIDRSQMDQILSNLCVNARDAIAGSGSISVATANCAIDTDYAAHVAARPGEYVRLTVHDNGCGMNKEILAHIFEPFFTTKAVGVGTGLGLSTVYGAVRQNNGFITVASEPDRGTTFEVYLPRYSGEVPEEAAKTVATEEMGPGRETILLVEDEPSILKLASKVLDGAGYTVLAAASPDEAMAIAARHPGEIHLVLTDVVMPGMSGQDLARALLALRPTLKRMFMSGYPADVMNQDGFLPEGVSFIQKPFVVADLRARVREVLGTGAIP